MNIKPTYPMRWELNVAASFSLSFLPQQQQGIELVYFSYSYLLLCSVEAFSLNLNNLVNSLSNPTTKDSFEISSSWGYQNCHWLLDLIKIQLSYWRLKMGEAFNASPHHKCSYLYPFIERVKVLVKVQCPVHGLGSGVNSGTQNSVSNSQKKGPGETL